MASTRNDLLRDLAGQKPPRLWCPPLTHYTPQGTIDRDRIAAHWKLMSPSVNAFLVPGSTGDAWEMTAAEQSEVLDLALDLAQQHGSLLLLGALKPDAESTRDAISEMLGTLSKRSGISNDPLSAMKACRVCGFVACAPRGRELSQEQIRDGLRSILELNVPTALYQLPQVTQNEIATSSFNELAARYPNLLFFKDSSGVDLVATDDRGRAGVFLVRGAEGRYAQSLQQTGGAYHGLLLSTANSFPSQLRSVLDLLDAGGRDEAIALSDRLGRAVEQAFSIVRDMKEGNAFANANKAMDHFMAFGAQAMEATPPRLHAGVHPPREVLEKVRDVLQIENLLPAEGYLLAKQ